MSFELENLASLKLRSTMSATYSLNRNDRQAVRTLFCCRRCRWYFLFLLKSIYISNKKEYRKCNDEKTNDCIHKYTVVYCNSTRSPGIGKGSIRSGNLTLFE